MKIKRPGHPEFVWELRYDGQASRSIFPVMSEAVRTIDLVESLDGQAWGAIPDCLAAYPGTTAIPAGEIVIPLGSLAEGYTHVREKHGHKIAHFHPGLSLESYLQNVLRHFQRIYLQTDGSLWLFRTNGTTKCAVVAPAIIDGVLIYKLITAYPIPREPDFARRGAVRLTYTG